MKSRRAFPWLWLFVGIALVVLHDTPRLVRALYPQALDRFFVYALLIISSVLLLLWFGWGWWITRQPSVRYGRAIRRIGAVVVSGLLIGGIAYWRYDAGHAAAALALAGLWAMAAVFFLGLWLIQFAGTGLIVLPIALIYYFIAGEQLKFWPGLGLALSVVLALGAAFAYVRLPRLRWVFIAILILSVAVRMMLTAMELTDPSAAVTQHAVTLLVMSLFLGLGLSLSWLASRNLAVQGVCRTVIDEAIRMKVVVIVLALVFVLVALLPTYADPKELLHYRIQTFLNLSLLGVSILLSLMTVVLAARTVCSEIADRQVYLSLTKPISRGQYLAGKWLGIALLNLLLMAVAGGAIYTFARVLERQPARSDQDRAAIRREVLTARSAALPGFRDDVLKAQMKVELEKSQLLDPNAFPKDKPLDQYDAQTRQTLQTNAVNDLHVLGTGDEREFIFRDLPVDCQPILRLKPTSNVTRDPDAPPTNSQSIDRQARLALKINQRTWLDTPDSDGKARRIFFDQRNQPTGYEDLPCYVIEDNNFREIPLPPPSLSGEISVTIVNVRGVGTARDTIRFSPGDGLEIVYTVDRFEPNFIRGLAILWLQLAFLAMLGLAVGSAFSFPVACLIAIMVYVLALVSGFLEESLPYFVDLPEHNVPLFTWLLEVARIFGRHIAAGEVWEAVKVLMRLVASVLTTLAPAFGKYDPIASITDGRLVTPNRVQGAFTQISLIWTGVCALFGWWLFRRRELGDSTS